MTNLIPITRPTMPLYDQVSDNFKQIFNSGMLTNYTFTRQLESNIKNYLNSKNIVAVSSCTSGLMLAFKTLELKGEVILPSFTFSATGHSLFWNNLTPKLVDIEDKHYCIDPDKVNEAITDKTSAILAVHMFGHPADIKALQEIATDNNLKLIFDAAHAFGSKVDNIFIGNYGDVEVFSCSPTKLMITGEGGIVSVKDDKLAAKIARGRNYGDIGNLDCEFPGLNARMSEFHSVVGIESLKYIEGNIEHRHSLVDLYKKEMKSTGVSYQEIAPNVRTTFKDFSLFIDKEKVGISAEELQNKLSKRDIMSKRYFYPPLHKQTAYKNLDLNQNLPVTDNISPNVLSLPLYSHMPTEEVIRVAQAVREIINDN